MSTWSFSNEHGQTGTLTKNSSGNWSYTPTDSDNPVNEYITQSGGTVTWYQIGEYQNYSRYTWPDTISSGDIVAADGTAVTGFTHNWGHTSLGTGKLTILASGGTSTEGVNSPYVTWNFPNRSCGETTAVSVTHTVAQSVATTYYVHELGVGQIGTILVGTGAYPSTLGSGNFTFTISARTLQVKDANGSVLSTRVFSCQNRKVHCNFW